ncbi:hypothetical protein [Roseivivax sp. THAF30]|uniref:hypothetical protein n=1 Tax=Roseivivax sp. THAF30 TaxID=2587852 RepID=UPI00126972B6|nr:hypothetical protein [Roseivivax sp. THAF30]QFT62760.1 hypothetical protein FIU91_07455 [Roseivivax sp. THAF30]
MTSNEYVTGLAEVMGVERTELATVDRALAKRGLRQVARGKSRPDINLIEGVRIALAWAGAQKLTEAADEVERLGQFFYTNDEPQNVVDAEFINLFGSKSEEFTGTNFWNMIVFATRRVGAEAYPSSKLQVHVTKNSGIEIKLLSGVRPVTVWFQFLGAFAFRKRRNVETTVSISGDVLKWIYDVTEGA